MIHRRRHNPAPHRRRRDEALPGFVAEALRRPGSAPDLTRAIMGRLGYMRAAPRVVRRERLRRNLGRGLFSLALIALLGVAVHLHEQSPLARRPAEVTLPAAIRNDLDRHHDQLHRVIHTIRNLAPAGPSKSQETAPTAPETAPSRPILDEDVNRSAVGPVRWV